MNKTQGRVNGQRRRRSQSRLILVIGDGESEKRYFENLSDLCPSIRIKAYATSKNSFDEILRRAEGYAKEHDMHTSEDDIVAIVMDLDNRFSQEQIQSMKSRCDEQGYMLFISNPCFEVWLLCHFRALTRPYSPKELVEDLDELCGGYKKSSSIEIDNDMVDLAIDNSMKMLPEELCSINECYNRNPSTMVHSLVRTIRLRADDISKKAK